MKVFIQRLTLIATLVACLAWAVGRPLGFFSGLSASPAGYKALEFLLALVLALLSALAINDIVRTIDRPAEQKLTQDTAEAIKRIEAGLPPRKVDLVRFPQNDAEYAALFSGFTGSYWVYNPSYQLERRPGMDRDALVKNVFVRRYKDPSFLSAYYLFLTEDEVGKSDLREFTALMQKTAALAPEVKSKLHVRQLANKKAASEAEIYRGTKDGVIMTVFEPTETVLTGGRGRPYYYFLVHDAEVNRRLFEQFNKDWDTAEAVDVFS